MTHLFLAAVLQLSLVAGAQEPNSTSSAPGGGPATRRGADAGTADPDEDVAESTFSIRHSTPSDQPLVRPTMDAFADLSTSEVRVGPVRARYSLNVFGDVGLKFDSLAADHPSFFLGNVDLLLGLRLEQGFSGVAELRFGVTDSANGIAGALGAIDLERFGLRWENENFFVEVGREHTEIGYWNNAWHHGIWLQPTYNRPRWIGFGETGLVPVHRIGAIAGVKVPLGPGELKASISVNNSRGLTRPDVRNRADLIDLKLLFGSVEYVGLFWRELRVGLSGIVDQIPATTTATATARPTMPGAIDEGIASLYVAYVGALILVDAETFYVHQQNGDKVWQNYGGFLVVTATWKALSPFAMVERIWRTGGASPFFVPVAAGAISTDDLTVNLGLRYDLSTWNALKAEYRFTRSYDLKTQVHEVFLSWNFGL